ncbi:hypothetical protein EDD29_3667 [Actinocorallia herbida]|uniref:Uncharacterized protein n=1 Tax=Actinocorallia herbida TaxID=58109 RepID=A0A3N1CXU3_9ACTN|nr:hypothetical protein [Actinocorallia herbida]ROO86104.1 hypothetical protein EDD29_3667 [Actinocorallia herbida]
MPDELTFADHLRPGLPSGDYRIEVRQAVSTEASPFTAARDFTVAGERFALPPALVRAVFPPDGSLGDHANTLPHLVVDRATLPWEREPGGPGTRPWLVLLVFDGAERPEPKSVTLGALSGGGAHIPVPAHERHETPADPVTVIDVPRELLARIMPSTEDLAFLAHVRRTSDGADTAVVLGHRLPGAGTASTAHLVSVEGRYGPGGFDLGPDRPGALVRLVTLASWRFSCLDPAHTFPRLARALADRGGPFRLPDSGDPKADGFLRQGHVPVRHRLRQGGRTVSWYRGPFVTGFQPVGGPRPVRAADQLLRYHPEAGMFDGSHAAAWQLGRLVALQHTATATALYGWKRRRAQRLRRAVLEGHPLAVAEIDVVPPPGVLALLADLAALRGVPLRYLVPDERLLPPESLRFFRLDRQWIGHLVDGAASIGRLTSADAEADAAHPMPVNIPDTSGVLLRSDLVAGYPDLVVTAYDAAGNPLPPTRTDRLSPSTLLCLFGGLLARLDLAQRPEALHFAVEMPTDDSVTKTPRAPGAAPLPALPLGAARTVPVATLAARLAEALSHRDFGPAAFAAQMIETAERVTFFTEGHPGGA